MQNHLFSIVCFILHYLPGDGLQYLPSTISRIKCRHSMTTNNNTAMTKIKCFRAGSSFGLSQRARIALHFEEQLPAFGKAEQHPSLRKYLLFFKLIKVGICMYTQKCVCTQFCPAR